MVPLSHLQSLQKGKAALVPGEGCRRGGWGLVRVALNWGCVVRVPTALVTRLERKPRLEKLPGDMALEGWGIRATASEAWAGRERIKMESGTCPPCASQHFPCPSTGPQATSWPIVPSEKSDTGGGLPCGRSSLMQGRLVGTARGEPPVLGRARREGGWQREDPSLHSSQGSSCAVGRGQCVGPANRR